MPTFIVSIPVDYVVEIEVEAENEEKAEVDAQEKYLTGEDRGKEFNLGVSDVRDICAERKINPAGGYFD